MNTKERNIGFDVFRILLAFMVFTLHVNGATTGGVFLAVNYTPVKTLVVVFEALCFPAVNCYILLSAYFSFKNKKTLRQQTFSLVKLFICLLTYSIVWFLVVSLAFTKTFSFIELVKRFFPLTSGEWWYMTNYFALMLISPFLNTIVENTDKKKLLSLIATMLVITSVMPFFVKGNDFFGVKMGYSLIWFIALYFTGAFISKYYFNRGDKKVVYLFGYVCCAALLPITSLLISKISFLNGFTFESYNSVIVYVQAIFLFLFFKNVHIKSKSPFIRKSVSTVALLSLSVYLFHCQVDVESILWTKLNLAANCNTLTFIPYYIAVTLCVYVFSCAFEFIRSKLMNIGNFENNLCSFITDTIEKIFKFVCAPFIRENKKERDNDNDSTQN